MANMVNYNDYTVADLRPFLVERGLPKGGLKVDIIRRLMKYDEEHGTRAAEETRGQLHPQVNPIKTLKTEPTTREAELVAILRKNHMHAARGLSRDCRLDATSAKYSADIKSAGLTRDRAIAATTAEYELQCWKAVKERNETKVAVESELRDRSEKRRAFEPALGELNVCDKVDS